VAEDGGGGTDTINDSDSVFIDTERIVGRPTPWPSDR
jgi:hypothetical protein